MYVDDGFQWKFYSQTEDHLLRSLKNWSSKKKLNDLFDIHFYKL